jgi:hypothetical protein
MASASVRPRALTVSRGVIISDERVLPAADVRSRGSFDFYVDCMIHVPYYRRNRRACSTSCHVCERYSGAPARISTHASLPQA